MEYEASQLSSCLPHSLQGHPAWYDLYDPQSLCYWWQQEWVSSVGGDRIEWVIDRCRSHYTLSHRCERGWSGTMDHLDLEDHTCFSISVFISGEISLQRFTSGWRGDNEMNSRPTKLSSLEVKMERGGGLAWAFKKDGLKEGSNW